MIESLKNFLQTRSRLAKGILTSASVICTTLLVYYLWTEHRVLFVLVSLSLFAVLFLRKKEETASVTVTHGEDQRAKAAEEAQAPSNVVIIPQPTTDKPEGITSSPTVGKSLASWVYAEKVPKDVAEGLIKKSTWWLTHRHGPVQAPNHYKRIFLSPRHGWSIEFGANTFLVGKAIQRCRNILCETEKSFLAGQPIEERNLRERLINAISGAVANNSNDEYYSYPVNEGGELVFGAQAIDVNQAVTYIIWASHISQLLAKQKQAS